MILWRIATETRKYKADDMTGAGAAIAPGRWNDNGIAVLYTAPTIAIAVLETAAHVDPAGFPMDRFLVRIDVPDATWNAREEVDIAKLPAAWSAIPAGMSSVDFGTEWINSLRTAILTVPSVIVPEECAALINPRHPTAAGIAATVVRSFEYDRLFRR